MQKNTQELIVSPPRQLQLGCPNIDDNTLNCGHAFPDLARFDDQFFLAFRTAPSHFPSKRSQIQILHSNNASDWQLEETFSGDMDIRDPQFLIFNGHLFLFYMSHSMQLFNHEPVHIFYRKRTQSGWSAPVKLPFTHSGFWNLKVYDGKVYMSIYTRNGHYKKRVKRHFALVATQDLTNWEKLFSSPLTRERLQSYQTSETTFDFDQNGDIFGTIRSLIYPNLNFRIKNDQTGDWNIKIDQFKCDGPKLFSHNGTHYLVARRSDFYKLNIKPYRFFNQWRNLVNIIRYSLSKKRTALYRFDPNNLEISHIQDLPSHGDTGYAAIAPMNADQFLLIYYSSDLSNREDLNWINGQFLGKTKLYAATLSIRK